MANLADLLKYKDELKIKHPDTGKVLWTGWIRILGDESLQEAYKYGRKASADKRALLKDKKSIEYLDEVASIAEQDKKDLLELILVSKENDFTRESVAVVVRDELPTMREVAEEPDAPSLEEQEILDEKEEEVQARFLKAIEKYVNERKEALQAELETATHKELIAMAQEEIMKVIPMQAFINELEDQKGFRCAFEDKACKTRAFATVEDYKDAHPAIKLQIKEAYNKLELGPDEIKN